MEVIITDEIYKTIENSLEKIGLSVRTVEAIHEGVSGAIKAVVYLNENGFSYQRVVAKYGDGVGEREAKGANLLQKYFNIPAIVSTTPDLHVCQFIAGPTLDSMIFNSAPDGIRVFKDVIKQHIEMWVETSKDANGKEVCGYPKKIDDTKNKLFFDEHGNARRIEVDGGKKEIKEIADLPIVLNRKIGPPLNTLLDRIGNCVRQSNLFALLHGDEGAGNYIHDRDGSIWLVDNEKAGIHHIEEGIAKILCWFSAIHSNEGIVVFHIEDKKLHIDFDIHISAFTREVIREAREEIKSLLQERNFQLKRAILHANCAMYYFREIQWLMRRGRHHMKPYLFCLGLQEAIRCWKMSHLI